MKTESTAKLIIGLLVLGLIVVAVLGFTNSNLLMKSDPAATTETAEAAAEPAAQADYAHLAGSLRYLLRRQGLYQEEKK